MTIHFLVINSEARNGVFLVIIPLLKRGKFVLTDGLYKLL